MIRFTNEEFTQLTTYMSSQYGIDLSKKKILAECRMNGELEKRGNISMGEYMRQMAEDRTKQLEAILLNRLTTNYTYFMREPKHFDFLRERFIGKIHRFAWRRHQEFMAQLFERIAAVQK